LQVIAFIGKDNDKSMEVFDMMIYTVFLRHSFL